MGLDVGGFIGNLQRNNDMNARCKICGRDRRLKGRISPNTEVTRKCNGCGEPMNWKTLDNSGERVEYEWSVQGQRAVKLKSSKEFKISFD